MQANGVYQIFLTLTPRGASTASPLLIASPVNAGDSNPEPEQLIFCQNTLESGQATAVVSAFTPAEDWFSFHEDHEAFETRDQAMLETVWRRLHASMPELGEDIEVIETASPQTFYETVRRRFGMIGRPTPSLNQKTGATAYPNLWIAGDTVAGGVGTEGIVESSWQLARRIIA
jgi:phytoene dehydrogenase-like protein